MAEVLVEETDLGEPGAHYHQDLDAEAEWVREQARAAEREKEEWFAAAADLETDRFGLAQLHQFRGRVGRVEAPSFCYLLSDEPGEDAVGRLSLVERNHNGFDLAQADLELRGPGDVFGLRQSGRDHG